MEALAIAAVAGLLIQAWIFTRALERQRQQTADLVNDLASRIVTPALPVPSRRAPAAPPKPREHPDAHLVGSVAAPRDDEE